MEMVEGQLRVRDQIREYIDRGEALQDWNYLEFFLGTYDAPKLKERTSTRGRHRNERVAYKTGCNREKRCRVIRSKGHETMPYVPGQWFPRKEADGRFLFEASMLALLKPWTSISDLKRREQTFEEAYSNFIAQASDDVKTRIENIQFYHECSEGARAKRSEEETSFAGGTGSNEETIEDDEVPAVDCDPQGGGDEQFAHVVTKEDVWNVLDRPFSACEERYAEEAIAVGLDSGALQCPPYETVYRKPPMPATQEDVMRISIWENSMQSANENSENETVTDSSVQQNGAVTEIGPRQFEMDAAVSILSAKDIVNESPSCATLNERQRMAYHIVTSHVQAHLRNENPPQRLMIVHGQGGTGKTAMLNAISNTFDDLGASHLLAKTAMSGVAASLIGGKTLHSWAALPVKTPSTDKWITHPGKEVSLRRKRNFTVLWVMVDEMSMLTTTLFDHLSQATGIVRTGMKRAESSTAFGGLSIMLLGDFHQLPPVANSKRKLYHSSPQDDSSNYGRTFFKQFEIVVKLEEQMRIVDAEWDAILMRARTGDCTSQDIEELRKLVLSNAECEIPDFNASLWNDAVLVTPRNGSRVYWNEQKLVQHCRATGHTHYVLYARDTTKGDVLTLQQQLVVACLKLEETNNLPNKVEMAVGMKAMVLTNIDTDSHLANGSRGIITDIVLDPRETVDVQVSSKIVLQYPPAAILFKPLFGGNKTVPGLPRGVIPIFPSRRSFSLKGGCRKTTIDREQYSLTPAYAFTDYKAQGQTMESVIVDLGKPPSGKLTAFNAYVALSRGRGRATIRLLREFDAKLFTTHPSEELRKEDDRLNRLAEITMSRYRAGEF